MADARSAPPPYAWAQDDAPPFSDIRRSDTVHLLDDDEPCPVSNRRQESQHYPAVASHADFQSPWQSEGEIKRNMAAKDHASDNFKDVWIAVMGVTGAGKSKFIKMCSELNVQVGHGLESCTKDVDEYIFQYQGGLRIHLIDTPGFDDTHRSDREVLNDIAGWLGTSYENDIRLAGIVYLHRITDPRMGGVSLRNLIMFKKLCGEDCYPHVMLATTFWDTVDKQIAVGRESELTNADNFWGKMIKRGSQTERCYGDKTSALHILRTIITNSGDSVVLDVQKEMVDQKMTLDETAAGREVSAEIMRERKKYEAELVALREAHKEALDARDREAAADIERDRIRFEEKIKAGMEDQKRLRASLEDLQKASAAKLEEAEFQVKEAEKALDATIEESRLLKEKYRKQDPRSPEAAQTLHRIDDMDANVRLQNQEVERKKKELEEKKQTFFSRAKAWAKKNPHIIMTTAFGIFKLMK